ncbi:MAG TPA: aminodeoxychorismate/anthranilate synthase component II [Patescibacteria group bacterium]
MRIVIIDNYDSFTYNLYQYIAEITHTKPMVYFNDKISFAKLTLLKPAAVVISPGPGTVKNAKDFGVSKDVILRSHVPVLGVCLGHQGIGFLSGSKITYAPEVMHGRVSNIYHTGNDLFNNIPQGFEAVRYHSLTVSELPKEVIKTAWTKDNVIMGLRHTTRPLWGVQFHPESIGTQYGKEILKNFFSLV